VESHLSRYERDVGAAGEIPPSALPSDQHEAIACYLSAGEGWREALKALRGAFASGSAATPAARVAGQNEHEINHRTSEYLQWPGLKNAETDND
jgi:hypothetical protein